MFKLSQRILKALCTSLPNAPGAYLQHFSAKIPQAVAIKKSKSVRNPVKHFVDVRSVRVAGGHGGDGCISFLSLFCNENAGPDGGDGGNGGHVLFTASTDVRDLVHLDSVIRADNGVKGRNKDCHGRNAEHCSVRVPVGTVIKDTEGGVLGDLGEEGMVFVGARGGAGGKGNHFFATDTFQTPEICEYGGRGEELEYVLEIRSMAHLGLIGFPNAGKSSLLQAISRARPKIAPYPFTTLKPHIGMILYDDYEQIAVADLPGLIPDSHKNKGLGIQFLRHAERCAGLLYIVDTGEPESWRFLQQLQHELQQFSPDLAKKPRLVIANKMDLPGSEANLEELRQHTDMKVVPISAKCGSNIAELLNEIRVIYDDSKS